MKSLDQFKVTTLEIAGLHSVLTALHLPFGGDAKSETASVYTLEEPETAFEQYKLQVVSNSVVSSKDLKLLTTLIKNGDEHAKCIRGLVVYAKITAPRFFWEEICTYEVGVTKMGSNSTMHQQGKGLATEDLVDLKEKLPEGTMQTRVYAFSYQTLRRIYYQRRNHRLPHWHVFCNWIKSLPFANEWITVSRGSIS